VGVNDPAGNNSATDVTSAAATADLSITKTDGLTAIAEGGVVTYTIVASNAGPSAVSGATVTDILPAQMADPSWTCTASAGLGLPGGGCGQHQREREHRGRRLGDLHRELGGLGLAAHSTTPRPSPRRSA
jgi:uncharacterized repeat protein (TIGR01451 family)